MEEAYAFSCDHFLRNFASFKYGFVSINDAIVNPL